MLKKAFILLLLALPCMAMAQDKVAFVSTQQILNKMPEYKVFLEKMSHKEDSVRKEAQAIEKEYQTKMEEFSKTADQELPAAVISDRQLQINKIQERFQALREYSEGGGMQQEAQAMLLPIQKKLNEAIEAVGKETGTAYILDQYAFQYTGAAAADLTKQVEAKLGLQ